MRPCVSGLGHLWSSEDPDLGWTRQYGAAPIEYPTIVFENVTAVMVTCLRQGCREIGYEIVAQNLDHEESA